MTNGFYQLEFLSRGESAARLNEIGDKFYVYVLGTHERLPFYVGKGSGNRIFQHESEAQNSIRRTHKLNVIRKLHREQHDVLYALPGFFDKEQDSLDVERELISQIGRHDLGTGPLTNQTDGGEGTSNPSEESRQRHLASLGGDAEDPERRLANQFFNEIGGKQSSVPVKPLSSWRRVEPLRTSVKNIGPTDRMAKAIVASAIQNNVRLEPGVPIPRLLVIDGVEFLIENGCGREMIKAGVVQLPKAGSAPRDETMSLTALGLKHVRNVISDRRLVELGVLEP